MQVDILGWFELMRGGEVIEGVAKAFVGKTPPEEIAVLDTHLKLFVLLELAQGNEGIRSLVVFFIEIAVTRSLFLKGGEKTIFLDKNWGLLGELHQVEEGGLVPTDSPQKCAHLCKAEHFSNLKVMAGRFLETNLFNSELFILVFNAVLLFNNNCS